MKIATNEAAPFSADQTGYDGEVTFHGYFVKAERKHRHILQAIYSVDTLGEVDDIMTAQADVIEALRHAYPDFYSAVIDAAIEVKLMLVAARKGGDQ